MTNITVEHLSRGAFVYVRQSTADQLIHNQESRRRQYGLAERARQLGWASVEVIDDDLGRSGAAPIDPASSAFWRHLRGACWRRARNRSVSPGPQWPRLAHADRDLRTGWDYSFGRG